MESNETKSSPYLIPVSILIAGAIIAGAVIFSRNGAPAGSGPAASGSPAPAVKVDDGGISLGDPKAPVTIVEFADFQCPFCGRFHQAVEPRIKAEYVQTGKARFIYRDFAFLDSVSGNEQGESHRAAEAARCANDQGKFWEYHDYLYEHQKGENQGAFSDDNLKRFAAAVGLDSGEFNSCFASGKHKDAVLSDTVAGRKAGVNGTPATFINGRLISGALPYEQFKAVIEEALAGK